MTATKQLEAALQALRIIHTWARVDSADVAAPAYWRAAMADIANMAAKGLGREDLIKKAKK